MLICPVCENQQATGFECSVCGKDLTGGQLAARQAAAPVPVERVEGLEARPERVGDVPVQAMADMEQARHQVGDVAVEVVPDVEQTRQAQVGEVAVERLGELSEDRAPQIGAPTQLNAGPVTCRYCRNVQVTGVICDRCGMRLPVFAPPVVTAQGGVDHTEHVTVRCKACGAPATAGQRCGDCGKEVPWPDE